jgi:hypothetical protein
MIKKEDFPYDKSHIAIPLADAIGKWLTCEDGIRRQVECIVHCAGSFQFAVINEDINTEKDGHLVHLLKMFHEMRNQPPPSDEEIQKFDEIAKSFSYEYVGKKGEGLFKRPAPQGKAKHSKSWFLPKGGKS